MIISKELRKNNIAEYILYMWQIEDLIRAYNFNIQLIKENLISKYQKPKEVLVEIEHWYEGLIDLMEIDKIKVRGHFNFLKTIIVELDRLNINLLDKLPDKKYIEYYNIASVNIEKLKEKSKVKNISDIEVCFNGLYGLLMFRLKKAEISKETVEAIKTISVLLSYLSVKYKENEEIQKN